MKIILAERLLLIVIIAGFVLFVPHLFNFTTQVLIYDRLAPPRKNIPIFYEQKKVDFGLPTRLKIPKINVDSAVEYVGLTQNGAMDVPKGINDVAWLKLGQRPGEIGSATIAGHFDGKNGEPAVFYYLNKLQKDDELYIEDDHGVNIAFIVREIQSYGSNADAADVFSSSDGKSHLNLITCEGVWNKNNKSYSKRLVIFTDKIE